MFKKLHTFYQGSILLTEKPNLFYFSKYHWFKDSKIDMWLGVPFDSIKEQELALLKTLFHFESPPFISHAKAQSWYDFLFFNGQTITLEQETRCQLIQFYLQGSDWEKNDIETAIQGFFHSDSIILWESNEYGVIIEMDPESKLDENVFISLNQLLESDFFLRSRFYAGKQHKITENLPKLFQEEKYFFTKALRLMPSKIIFTFEKAFPAILTTNISNEMQDWLLQQLFGKISDDPELIQTVKLFLENNSNSTLTAKQLYIHRNTLQYRLEKFTEKTGVNLKTFYNAMTIYLACLLYEGKGR